MKIFALIGLGGAVGSICRYLTGALLIKLAGASFPLGTFTVNIAGCFLIGLAAALIEHLSHYNAELRLLLITGFLGGFTTFSAFGLETLSLLKNGQFFLATLNILLNVLLGIISVYLGIKFGEFVMP